ncbi:precorrin-6A synthase (deacetylating) [Aliiroseovarius sp.]|uniref:precorrin-6A synthase (deacetylating) n=1 Tax=Aliiroseovarius sp. TaxID=1872442 RepID=UPI003BA90867
MHTLSLIGIGAGNPKHLTLEAIEALNACDLILIPLKGAKKDDLAQLRREICAAVLTRPVPGREFTLPVRDPATADYHTRVNDWHDAIADCWQAEILAGLPEGGRVGFLVWGDPSLYDSTLRIADRLTGRMEIALEVIPGITSIQALTAGHAIPLNTVGGPVTVTTGRQLRDHGWPEGAETLVVMLDQGGAFEVLDGDGFQIWWSAYAGMANEIRIAGPLSEVRDRILSTRAEAREDHGWIMDVYLLRRLNT